MRFHASTLFALAFLAVAACDAAPFAHHREITAPAIPESATIVVYDDACNHIAEGADNGSATIEFSFNDDSIEKSLDHLSFLSFDATAFFALSGADGQKLCSGRLTANEIMPCEGKGPTVRHGDKLKLDWTKGFPSGNLKLNLLVD